MRQRDFIRCVSGNSTLSIVRQTSLRRLAAGRADSLWIEQKPWIYQSEETVTVFIHVEHTEVPHQSRAIALLYKLGTPAPSSRTTLPG